MLAPAHAGRKSVAAHAHTRESARFRLRVLLVVGRVSGAFDCESDDALPSLYFPIPR